ncbi:MAG TPA: G8 domain-containing protein [Candidatus Acidoferrales bacterium]|nr:G8 domain-containing protein [Candidatus Acidoferrales bacterium]
MRRQYRSFLFALLVPTFFLVSAFDIVAAAQEQESHAIKQELWSNPATWPDGKAPGAGDTVTIEKGKDVLLDVSPPSLGGLQIKGKLSFSDKADIELTTESIIVHGELEIGTEAKPHTRKATITLTDNVPGNDRGIMIEGGTLNLHGDRTNSWTKLAGTAKAGSARIEVLNAGGWRKGDVIVLAPTDFDSTQAEKRTIAAIAGKVITLDQPLKYMHFGKITFGVDERGEVGLLTRNILIQASNDAERSYFGGHIMAMTGSKMYVSGVELNRMGQNMHLARYPIHWHLVGDGQGQYIQNSAIHDTYSRCVTVHGTNNVRVENNVAFNTVGHCYFLEDAVETGNQFIHNLGMRTKCHPDGKPCVPTNLGPVGSEGKPVFDPAGQSAKDILIPSDNTASTFWITNPDNIFRDNVAAGSEATGFWLALPQHPTGAFEGTEVSKATWPRRTRLREFKGNIAHSNFDGFMFDRGPQPDGHIRPGGHMALANPADGNSPIVETVIEDFTSYKNRNSGMWARGEMDTFKNLKLADNAIGYTHASGNFGRSDFTSRVVDSLFVGETENIGNPGTPVERAYGRSLPEPEVPDFPIRGYEFYDYRHELDNDTFVNYQDNATRKTGAISYLLYTSFGMSTNNAVQRAKFINAKPVYFPPMQNKWTNDDYGNGSYKTSVFHDVDGSVSGVPDSYILINDQDDEMAIDDACVVKPTWNAAVCKGDVGRLAVVSSDGSGAAPGIPGSGAPAAGPARTASTGAGAAMGSGPTAGPGAYPSAAAGPGPAAGSNPGAYPSPAANPGPAGSGPVAVRPNPGGVFGRSSGPPQPPVVVSRNGKEFTLSGPTNIRAGTEIKVTTERPSVALQLSELDSGSWVIFELPGFATAASGTPQDSLDALRKASATSYFKGKDSLWVKVVSNGEGARTSGPGAGGTSVQVSR